jgi:hypothetical protein
MKTLRTLGAAIIVSALLSATAIAAEQQGGNELPAVSRGVEVTSISTVESVNMRTRKIRLRESDGKISSFVAGDEVRNLAQVKVGDLVIVKYSIGLVMALNKSGTNVRSRVDKLEAGRAKLGQKPGAIVRKTVTMTANVTAVDTGARTVTLKGAKRTLTLAVASDIDLSKVKVGDQVDAEFEESTAISVEPAPKAK